MSPAGPSRPSAHLGSRVVPVSRQALPRLRGGGVVVEALSELPTSPHFQPQDSRKEGLRSEWREGLEQGGQEGSLGCRSGGGVAGPGGQQGRGARAGGSERGEAGGPGQLVGRAAVCQSLGSAGMQPQY